MKLRPLHDRVIVKRIDSETKTASGIVIPDAAAEKPKCPVIFHWGETDASIPKEHWEKVKQHHPNLTQYVYPAGHGFHCDERASYHKPSAEQAMERSLQFLRQHVG